MNEMLNIQDLDITFQIRRGLFGKSLPLRAVNNVTFTLQEGEILGIVGESGSGKSTIARGILNLVHPSGGRVVWLGRDIANLDEKDMRPLRADMQMIFQDPLASLNPRMTVAQVIEEPLRNTEPDLNKSQREARVIETMEAVGLAPEMIRRYPHEFSGGQAQRIGIARALITRPKLIICDEPVSALDVSIQAQIIRLLHKLRKDFGISLIFISHDLSIVRLISDRLLVLYLGQIMEIGSCDRIFDAPQHPYTQALLSAAPIPDPKIQKNRQVTRLTGEIPSPINQPSGCPFQTRCPRVKDLCREKRPALENGTACHYPGQDG